MGRPVVTDRQSSFAGGLNTVTDPLLLGPTQAQAMTNYRLTTVGAAVRRYGTQFVQSNWTATKLDWGFYWPKNGHILLKNGTGIRYCTYPAVASNQFPVTINSIAGGTVGSREDSAPAIFVDSSGAEVVYCATGATGVQKWDGSAFTTGLGDSKAFIGCCTYNARLWAWVNGSNGLYYSPLSTETGSTGGDGLGLTAQNGGVIYVTTFNQSAITCAYPLGSSLLVFHAVGISRLTGWGQDDISVAPQALNPNVSLVNQACICSDSGYVYFVTDRGLFTGTSEGVGPVATPDQPDPLVPYLTSPANASPTTLADWRVVFNRAYREVWVYVPSVGVFAYNVVLRAWSGPFTSASAGNVNGFSTTKNCFFQVQDSTGRKIIWMGSGSGAPSILETDRYIYQGASGTYTGFLYYDFIDTQGNIPGWSGVAITGTLTSRRMRLQVIGQDKAIRWTTVTGNITTGNTVSVTTTTPAGSDAQALTPTTGQRNYYLQGGGQGAWAEVTVADSGTSGASAVTAIEVDGFVMGRR